MAMADAPKFTIEFGRGEAAPDDGRLDAAAFHRNHAAIAPMLENFLKGRAADVLEIGSGTGQHAVAFAQAMPAVTWWPSDHNDNHLRSIEAWRTYAKLENAKPPIRLDASVNDWRLTERGLPSLFTAIFSANVIHIAPWSVAVGLFAGAGRHLVPGGRLFLYGPFRRDGVHNAPSNAAFDASLRNRNPEWGVRDIADLKRLGGANGLRLAELIEMPSNNAVLAFERATQA
jgi:SAM-dependent methyltransferase